MLAEKKGNKKESYYNSLSIDVKNHVIQSHKKNSLNYGIFLYYFLKKGESLLIAFHNK